METLFELKNIFLYSNDFPILNNISLSIPAACSTVITGHSGCGKSTLLKVLAGIMLPDAGEVFYLNSNLHTMSEKQTHEFKKINGFAFQDSALWANKNIFENLSLPLHFHFPELSKQEILSKVQKVLTFVNLMDSMYLRPAELSIGERKLVSMMRAVICDPTIVFMDDPTTTIDQEMRKKILTLMKNLKHNRASLVMVTNDPEIIASMCDYLVLLKQGMLIAAGPFEEIKKSQNEEVRAILSSVFENANTFDQDILDLLNQ
ncbi:MAG: ATP-binding cassette domain-containing protein [Spirochaetales bacterium]|nr:ATP-binding cassette domain-containing protein [Spirochaetales bacterium]